MPIFKPNHIGANGNCKLYCLFTKSQIGIKFALIFMPISINSIDSLKSLLGHLYNHSGENLSVNLLQSSNNIKRIHLSKWSQLRLVVIMNFYEFNMYFEMFTRFNI